MLVSELSPAPDEIEITREMIEAGEIALREAIWDPARYEDIARDVFTRMTKVSASTRTAKLRVYDVHTDEYRPATQSDIDRACRVVQAFGILRSTTKVLLEATLEMAQGKRSLVALDDLIRERGRR